MLFTGTTLGGRYTIEGVVGQGGMGAVYRARMQALGGKLVAIKEMTLSVPDQMKERALEQFRTEATMLANLDHPNLVQVTDFFEEAGHHYLVMAFVEGKTLAELQRENNGPFRVYEVLEWARQLCSVLEYLHTRTPPIIFRDLKPSNIMVDANNRIRLIDFGIAKNFNPESSTCTFLQGMGTAGYAPLEQYGGAGSTDARSDQYALGATLYHLLTGQVPANPIEIVSLGIKTTPPRELNPTIPPALDRAIMRTLGVRQDERYPDIGAFQRALGKVGNDQEDTERLTTGATAPAPPPPASPAPVAPVPGAAAPVPSGSLETAPLPREGGVQPFWMATAIGLLMIGALAVYRLTDVAISPGESTPAPTPVARASAAPSPRPSAKPTTKPTKKPTPKPTSKPTGQASNPRPTPRPTPRVTSTPRPRTEPEVIVVEPRPYPQHTRKPKPEPQPEPSVVFVPAPPQPQVVLPPPPPPIHVPAGYELDRDGKLVLMRGWQLDREGRPVPPMPNGEPVPMKDGYPAPPAGGPPGQPGGIGY